MKISCLKKTKKPEFSFTPKKPNNVSFNQRNSDEIIEEFEKKKSLLDSDNDSSKIAFPKLLKKN